MNLTQDAQAGAGVPFDQRVAHPAPVNEHALLNEFKMAAQSFIEAGRYYAISDEDLKKHADWFKELLA